MRVLLDHCVPKRLRTLLAGHDVKTARQMGWDRGAELEHAARLAGEHGLPHVLRDARAARELLR